MSTFRFKRFSVTNERSPMKVGTDGVLLGAAVSLDSSVARVLDVGTGTGTIALMVAQRLSDMGGDFMVEAIDIDAPSAEEAAANFAASPWAEHLRAGNVPLQRYSPSGAFDLIVSNPPYFDDSLQAPEARRNAARHISVAAEGGESLSYRELAVFASDHLSSSGRLAIILPADQEHALIRCMASYSLHLRRIIRIRTTPRKPVSRIIAEFGKGRCDPVASSASPAPAAGSNSPAEETLTIQDGGAYTPEYLAMTHEFYLFA